MIYNKLFISKLLMLLGAFLLEVNLFVHGELDITSYNIFIPLGFMLIGFITGIVGMAKGIKKDKKFLIALIISCIIAVVIGLIIAFPSLIIIDLTFIIYGLVILDLASIVILSETCKNINNKALKEFSNSTQSTAILMFAFIVVNLFVVFLSQLCIGVLLALVYVEYMSNMVGASILERSQS